MYIAGLDVRGLDVRGLEVGGLDIGGMNPQHPLLDVGFSEY